MLAFLAWRTYLVEDTWDENDRMPGLRSIEEPGITCISVERAVAKNVA